MADKKITQLNALLEADVAPLDVAAVADISANETRKVTTPDLVQAGIRLMPSGSIPGSKIEINTISGDKLEKNSVTGGLDGQIALDTITADNIADNAVGADELADNSVDTAALQTGAVIGDKVAENTLSDFHIAPNAIGASELANASVDTAALQDDAVTGAKLNPSAFDRSIDLTSDKVGISNVVVAASQAGITWNEQGLITGATALVPSTDLPVATDVELGAVFVPSDGGLSVTGLGGLSITNTVTPGTYPKIAFNRHGLVTGGTPLTGADLPLATSTQPGAVIVPDTDADGATALDIAGDGSLTHSESSVTAGIYPKVGVDKYGHVISGSQLASVDIPDLSYDQITTGFVQPGSLAENCVTGPNIADYAVSYMQEGSPGVGDHLGQFWFQPSTSQLRIYARGSSQNQWMPVGFGALQANNLRWGGSYDAETNTLTVLTAIGTGEGLKAGDPFPVATDPLSGMYFICQTAGNNMSQPDLNGKAHSPGDWSLCIDESQGWLFIDAAAGSGGGGGGAAYLNDLLDVELTGTAADDLLKYDGDTGLWKNNDVIDGGSID